MGLYLVAWLLVSYFLPRPAPDPGVPLPGAALVAVTLAGLQAVSQLYLPARFDRASLLYGAVGVTIVTLGWFFIMGRVIVVSLTLDAVVFERFGSVTTFVFDLPVLRAIPRRVPAVGRFFGLAPAPPDDDSDTPSHDHGGERQRAGSSRR